MLQTRLLAVLLCEQFFSRSRHFRALLAARFQTFVELTIGLTYATRLPKPPEIAAELRAAAVKLIAQWDRDFGSHYGQLGVACRCAPQLACCPLLCVVAGLRPPLSVHCPKCNAALLACSPMPLHGSCSCAMIIPHAGDVSVILSVIHATA